MENIKLPDGNPQAKESADVLRGRFTNWLAALVYREKISFIRKQAAQHPETSLDEPPKRQEMLKLLFVDELSPTEVAERLNCTVQHVYNRRSQALKALKAALGEGGGDL